MEKKIIWVIITSVFLIIGVVFAGIILFNIFKESFWLEIKYFGWDHFYTFVIIMAVVFLGIGAILEMTIVRKLEVVK
ncbi:MAG: hypothetical protein HWN66_22245 [Candidatus Helarchaeota archaeon]|nr:hypothetical protein [Candidatus Helarchaeota archaeon]